MSAPGFRHIGDVLPELEIIHAALQRLEAQARALAPLCRTEAARDIAAQIEAAAGEVGHAVSDEREYIEEQAHA